MKSVKLVNGIIQAIETQQELDAVSGDQERPILLGAGHDLQEPPRIGIPD